ncbi:MAG TPA: alpha-ketoacid dehydrogenase subunit beta [Pseudonocardiaceae bacterium]|nr:alpha-ketoacid dehydrogenase subunit beta [Pseudonocardiaceae bacterium]
MTSGPQTITLAKGLNQGLRAAMEADPKVIVMGEDVGKLGGVFRITDGLQKDFGEQRVLDTPLGESGIIGAAVGLALRGYRPVCEIQFDGFVFPAFDQIVTQLARFHYRSQGKLRMPVVVRVPYGGGIGAVEHHSESPESYFAHTPGLKVVSCANTVDAYWMIQQAIACDDPVIFFEPKRRYWEKAPLDVEVAPPPLFCSRLVRSGTTAAVATVVAYGPMVRTVLDAATVAEQDGQQLEVIDLRTLSPLDLAPVFDSVRRTGRLICVSEAPGEASLIGELAARVSQECFYSLEAPVLRVTGFDTPYPPAKCEEDYLPDLDRILDAVDRVLAY